MSESLRDLVVSLSLNSDNFTQNIKSVGAQIKEAESSFKLAGAGVTKFESTTAGLTSKLGMLQQKVSLQKSAVDQYQRALAAANVKLQESVERNDRNKASLEQARQRYGELGQQVKTASAKHQQYAKSLGESDSATIAAQANLDALEREYKETGDEVKRLDSLVEPLSKHMQRSADDVSRWQTALNGAQAELRETEAAIKACNKALSGMSWTKAGTWLTGLSKEFTSAGKVLEGFGKTLTKLATTPIAALGGFAIKAAIDFEDAFAGVRKTVDATEARFEELQRDVKDMSLEVPSNTSTISGVMEVAGQLGIANDYLTEFTRTMIDLSNTTDMAASDAATNIAKFVNITNMDHAQIANLGAAVVDLGNNFATTESSLMALAMRLASAGSQVGLTEPQILGFATALSSVGMEAEAGGTAFSKAMIKMQVAVETNSSVLTDFAKVSGMTAQQFKDAWTRSPAEAIQAFLVGLSKMSEEGVSAIATLEDMGIKEVRLRDTLMRATNASALFSKAVSDSNKAWKENGALTKEANTRYGTMKSQLEIMKNKATLFAQVLGDDMTPTVKKLMAGVNDLMDSFMGLDKAQRTSLIQKGALVAAIGPSLTVLGKLATTVGKVTGTLGKFSTKVGDAGGGLKGLVSVIGSSKTAMLGLAAAVIYGAYQFYDWASGAKACREALEGMNATAEKWRSTQASTVYDNGGLEAFGLSKEQFTQSEQTAKQWLSSMIATWSDGKAETDEIVSGYAESFAALTENTKSALDKLRQTAQDAGHTGIASDIQQDMDKLDAVNAQIEKLLKKQKGKKLSEKDQLKLQELIDTKEAIEVKYKLTPEATGGYAQVLQGIEAEVARAQARGQKGADAQVYAQGLTATAQGYAAIREQIDQNYASEYALIQLMDEGAEKDAARVELDKKYNEQRKAAAEEYANTIAQMISPVWEQQGIQQAKGDMDALVQLFREYSTLGGAGYKNPEILERMNALFEGMDKDELLSYLGVLQQVQSLMDGGMSEAEVQKLFPEIDFTKNLDQFAALAQFAKDHDGELKSLSDTLNGIIPDEMKKLSVELDMTAAEARWAEFAANPGAITTDAIILSYADAPDAVVPDATVDALVSSYREIEGGASTTQLVPDDVVAQVSAYLEGENCSIAALNPDQINAIVNSYSEATGADKSALLAAFQAKIASYDDTGATLPKPPKVKSTIEITGYDLAALEAFKAEHPVEVKGILRLGEQFENPSDAFKDKDAKFYMNGEQIPVNIVPREKITADTLFVYDSDGSMHVLVTPEIVGTSESADQAGAKLDEKHKDFNIYGYEEFVPTIDGLKDINAQLDYLEGSLGTWSTFWGLMDGKSKEGMENMLAMNLNTEQLADIQTFVQETTAAIQNGEQISDDAVDKLQTIQQMVELLDTLGIGQNVSAGIGAAMAQAGFEGDAETTAANLQSTINRALGIQSPSTRMKPTGSNVAAGVGAGMTEYTFATDASTVSSNLKTAMDAAITNTTLKSVGTNAMAGLASGIRSGKSDVVTAIKEVATAAVQAAKDKLKIESPSKVFQNDVGRMMTKGMAQGALLESKAQAKVIANAARHLTGAARDGVSSVVASDNRRSYQSDNSVALNVDKLVVNDKHDARALAYEISTVQRRAALGMGG